MKLIFLRILSKITCSTGRGVINFGCFLRDWDTFNMRMWKSTIGKLHNWITEQLIKEFYK